MGRTDCKAASCNWLDCATRLGCVDGLEFVAALVRWALDGSGGRCVCAIVGSACSYDICVRWISTTPCCEGSASRGTEIVHPKLACGVKTKRDVDFAGLL